MRPDAPPPRRIAIAADDFGLDPGIDEAILQLVGQGRVSVVSCMTAAGTWPAAAAALRDTPAASADFGLHLDLTQITVDPALRRPLSGWILRSWLRAVDVHALRREIDAQLDRFELHAGRAPAHVDGHQHVHQFPIVREMLVQALVRRYPAGRVWLRSTARPAGEPGLKPWVLESLGSRAARTLALAHGIASNRALLGVYGFADAGDYGLRLAGWLRRAQTGDLLMCHPATASAAGDPIAAARLREYATLAGDAFLQYARDANVRVEPMSAILAGSAAQ